jgi:hypothetical protein
MSGGGGIRTHGPLARATVFKTAPFDRSGTPPIPLSKPICGLLLLGRVTPSNTASNLWGVEDAESGVQQPVVERVLVDLRRDP